MARPPVSVVVPFHGSVEAAGAAAAALAALVRAEGDEVIVADNTETGVFAAAGGDDARVIATEVKRSAYAARNIGAEHAVNEWILFLDADCSPRPDILDRYFDPPPGERVGALAGALVGVRGQPGLAPAYSRSRGHYDQALGLAHPYKPMAVTGNVLVRRAAWESIGGFHEQTRSGADADFSWRLLDAGWEIELRERAEAEHRHLDTLRRMLGHKVRDGAGARWLSRRWPGHPPHPRVGRELARGVAGALGWPLLLQPRRGLFKAVDVLYVVAEVVGSWGSNATPTAPAAASDGATVAFAAEFPADDLPPAADLIEAERRPARPEWRPARAQPVRFAEDEGPLVRAAALARLAARRPLAVSRALAADRRTAAKWAPAALRLVRSRGSRPVAAAGAEHALAVAARMAGRRR